MPSHRLSALGAFDVLKYHRLLAMAKADADRETNTSRTVGEDMNRIHTLLAVLLLFSGPLVAIEADESMVGSSPNARQYSHKLAFHENAALFRNEDHQGQTYRIRLP
jgi:hypothetical protein